MAKKDKKKKSSAALRILLIDASNYIHRGYWAVEALSNSDGFPTNAIKGTINIILKDIKELKPDRVVICFDKGGKKNWRSEIYPEYKRSEARVKQKEDDTYANIRPQFKPIKALLKAMGFRTIGKKGVEADDLMATLATEFSAEGHEVLISTNDKDLAAMVTHNVFMVTAKERELLDPVGIKLKYGVKPTQIVDYLMLQGDKVDNIPGVTKCGPGTAAKWLQQYGSLKNLLDNVDDFKPAAPKRKGGVQKPFPIVIQNLIAAKKHFKLTRKLVTLKCDESHKVTLSNCVLGTPDWNKIKRLCDKYELNETHKEIKKVMGNVETSVSRWAL